MAESFLKGLLNNFIITIGSSVVPMIVGVLSYLYCRKKASVPKYIRLLGIVFESFCPIIVIVFLIYKFFGSTILASFPIWIAITGFTISFLGYMLTRYNSDYSLAKNIVVNGIGLFSTVFKWSFLARSIGVVEMLGAFNMQVKTTYRTGSIWIVLIVSFIVIFILELMKYIAKEKL